MKLQHWLKSHSIEINDIQLIERAFVHRSYKHEHPELKLEDNQRLEFIGDAVLQLWSADFLYAQIPAMDEGSMTKLRAQMVCEPSLAQFARQLELAQFLKLGNGEIQDNGQDRDSTLADLFEAFIGALYLDGGLDALEPLLSGLFKDPNAFKSFGQMVDYKTLLQEYVQAEDRKTIDYVLLNTDGPSNARSFEVAVRIDGMIYGKGKGSSKKRAEQAAAQEAIGKLVK